MKFNWKIGGEAGFGITTSGVVFDKIATRSGYHVFDYMEYPSLIRGGHNTVEILISDEEVNATKWEIDLLVCLNKDTFDLHNHRLHSASVVVYDPDVFNPQGNFDLVPLPLKKIKTEQKIHQNMLNTVAIGASVGLLGGELQIFKDILKEQFGRKGDEVVDFNIKLAEIGYQHVQKKAQFVQNILKPKPSVDAKLVVTGNDAFSIGAVGADCQYYAAYPMTPSSTVLSTMANWQYITEKVVRHPEDEISVINSALGASFAGARSAVGTSGGGFALMTEAVSFAGIAEIGVVIFLSMRPGPATGLPTWTEQGDLLFAVHSGHGEFPKIVLAPGDSEEMIELTLKAFDLADIYQTPVIVLSDKFISESHISLSEKKVSEMLTNYQPNRGRIVSQTLQNPYLRFKYSEDGISEQLIPGQPGVFYQANSYEHIEDSHSTEESSERIKQVDKRNQKLKTYINVHFEGPKVFGNLQEAEIVFVSWGGNKGPIQTAQQMLEMEQLKTAYIHFTHVFPIPDVEEIRSLFSHENKRYILVENNSQAQFGRLLRMQTGVHIQEELLKYDGRPFWPEEIRDYVRGKNSRLEVDLIKKLEQRIDPYRKD